MAKEYILGNVKGPKGDTGPAGATGPVGPQGSQGVQGTKGAVGTATTVSIGMVTTGGAGTNAVITNAGTSRAAVFSFTVPRGATGAQGAKGDKGATEATDPAVATGPAGPQGLQGAKGATGAQGVTVSGLLTTDKQVHISPNYSTTLATTKAQQEAWNLISTGDVTANNQLTFKCFGDKPATAIPIKLEVTR